MSKGKKKHQERHGAIQIWGKDLARRAKRKCELCEGTGDLRPYDGDLDVEPSMDTLVLACERCRAVIDGRKDDPRTLRFLETAVWNEHPMIASLAKKMLSAVDEDWARSTLDMLS